MDGNRNWDWGLGIDCTWYSFIKVILSNRNKYDYYVHIDEDCFLTSPDGILEALERIRNENYDLIGPQDVFEMFRIANHRALNSFLMIGKIESLSIVWKKYDQELKFQDIDQSIDPRTRHGDIELEPYYSFFWNFYHQDLNIGFINTGYSKEFECTTLMSESSEIFGYHMWYTRNWYSRNVVISKTNRDRYLDIGRFLRTKFGFRYTESLRSINFINIITLFYSRFIIKTFNRIGRKVNAIFYD